MNDKTAEEKIAWLGKFVKLHTIQTTKGIIQITEYKAWKTKDGEISEEFGAEKDSSFSTGSSYSYETLDKAILHGIANLRLGINKDAYFVEFAAKMLGIKEVRA